MDRTVWIIIAVVALAVAGFFGYRSYQTSQEREAERQRAEATAQALETARQAEKDAVRKAEQEATARELAERKARQDAEAESRRLAQAQAERLEQEEARKRAEAEAAKAAQDIDRIRAEKARLEAEARRLEEVRAKEAATAEEKLAKAQQALSEMERQKNAEIDRQAKLIASYSDRKPSSEPAIPMAAASAPREVRFRPVYPSDFKRAAHINLHLLPQADGN